MHRLVVVVLANLPAVAFADPEATLEQEARALVLPAEAAHGFHAAAFAQLASGTTDRAAESTLGAGGELRYTGDLCDYVRVGGQGRLSHRDGAHASAEQWASACLPIFGISVMDVGHHLEWDVRPSLLAPLQLRAGTNRHETVTYRWQLLRAPLANVLDGAVRGEAAKEDLAPPPPMTAEEKAALPQGDAVVFDVRVEHEALWGAGRMLVVRDRAEAVPFGYIRRHAAAWGEARDFSVEIGSGGGDFVERGATIHVWFLRLENLELGPLYATGGLGIASADAGAFLPPDAHGIARRQVDVTRPRAELALETGGTKIHGHVRATHDAAVMPDGYVTVDARITAGLAVPMRDLVLRLDGAIARTDVLVPEVRAIRAVTGGGSLALARHLTGNLDATLQLDVARSFYATDTFAPRWGVDAFAAVQAKVGR